MRSALALLGILVLVTAGMLLANAAPGTRPLGLDHENFARLAALFALLLVIGGGLFAGSAVRLAPALRALVAWCMLGAVLVTGYTNRNELAAISQRVLGGIVPGTAVVTRTGELTEISLDRGLDRHFLARGAVNGARTVFLVDTGASRVTLSADTARAANIPVDELAFSIPVRTANGLANVAEFRIAELSLGPANFIDVEAYVAPEGALDFDLLGVNALDRLDSYEVRGDRMVLRLRD